MSSDQSVLDEVDRGILYSLQQDARHSTTTEMGERIGVAGSTVRNRLDRLEERGVIRGYHPEIDYEAAGLHFHVLFTCTALDGVDELGERVLDQRGVVTVRELLAGEENLHVEAVGTSTADLTRIADALRELGLDIVRSEVLKNQRTRPFDRFDESSSDDE